MADYDVMRNPIYHAIIILNKNIDKTQAFKYSNIIAHYSRKYELDPFLIVSISRQESYINLKATRQAGEEKIHYDSLNKKFMKQVEVTDFCMMQINKGNVIWKELDPERLLSDADYCIHEGVKILTYFKPLQKDDAFWWTRYNSASSEHRSIYKGYVLHHYSQISDKIPNFEMVRKVYTSSKPQIAMEGKINYGL